MNSRSVPLRLSLMGGRHVQVLTDHAHGQPTCAVPDAHECGCAARALGLLSRMPQDATVVLDGTPVPAGWLTTAPEASRLAEFIGRVAAAAVRHRTHGAPTVAVVLRPSAGHLHLVGRAFGGVMYPTDQPLRLCDVTVPVRLCADCVDRAVFGVGFGDLPEVWLEPGGGALSARGWGDDPVVNLAVISDAVSRDRSGPVGAGVLANRVAAPPSPTVHRAALMKSGWSHR